MFLIFFFFVFFVNDTATTEIYTLSLHDALPISLVKERESEIDINTSRTVDLNIPDVKIRVGKFGAYLEAENGDEVVTASIPRDLTPADLDPEKVEKLLKQKTEGPDRVGIHPETAQPIFMLIGPYGPYVQLGEKSEENPKPKQASLPKKLDPENVTLEIAVGLLSLPRKLGEHPETGASIQANLGRFGPYVVHNAKEGKDYRSLKAGDDVLSVTLERALELLSEPKKGRGSRSKSKKPLRELGSHPDTEEPVNIYEGPYGVYIKHGKTNIGIPEGETPESITLEKALELLASKAPKGKSTRKTSKSKTTSTKSKTTSTKSKSKNKTETS